MNVERRMLNFETLQHINLSQLAYNLRYFDQSHLSRDFKRIIGTTPFSLNKNNSTLRYYDFERNSLSEFKYSCYVKKIDIFLLKVSHLI